MSLTTSSVATQLREQTAVYHSETESCLLPRLKNIESVKEYRELLKMFYGYFFPVQESIKQYITTQDLPDINQRRSARLILKDLEFLQDSGAAIKTCAHLPSIDSKAEAFGALYVLEGSTLGGRMIAKMLLRNPAVSLNGGLHFFNGYGEATAAKWKLFLEVLDTQAELSSIVAAANQTFLLLKNWINESLYHEC